MTARPTLMVYKEIVAGDLRKLVAESNDSKTGGGARDLRLPWKTFRSVMHRIFTTDACGRGQKPIRTAEVTFIDANGQLQRTTLEYWPPTATRPREDRIARVDSSPALGGNMPASDRGRIFVVFTKFNDGGVRCDFAYEDDLKGGKWAAEASTQILNCMASAALRKSRTVQGYYDFNEGTGFCHAD